MITITFKYKRPTQSEHGHTQIIVNNRYGGYLMKEYSKCVGINDNWYVSLCAEYFMHRHFRTRKEAVQFIESKINGKM